MRAWPLGDQLVLASRNPGKLRELQALLQPAGIVVLAPTDWTMPAVDEPHPSFVENALVKARHASAAAGLPALADDSGLCVPALEGAPGVRSARYAATATQPEPSDEANNARLIQALQGCSARAAYFYCVLVAVRTPHDPQPLIAEGVWWGEIIDVPRGQGGFGYDPHFYVPEHGCTSAELAPAVKNQISHRARAMRQWLDRLTHDGA